MTFELRFGEDGQLHLTGTPAKGSRVEVFRRNGPFRLNGEELVSPALNEGQPVHVHVQAGIAEREARWKDALVGSLYLPN